jgi:type I restriction enzyme, S subunit
LNYKIKELCEINSCNLSKKDNLPFINYLDTSNITEGKIGEIKKLEIGIDKIPSRAKRKVKKNDIIISTVRPNLKHYGILKNPVPNMIVSTGFAVLSAKEHVNPEYLYWYLTQQKITDYLSAVAETSTTAYPSITADVIGNIEIDLPSRSEQDTIANILTALDDRIELNTEINQTLEEMAQAIFKRWFVDFEFPNENGEPYKSSGGKFVESELGMIPKGWRSGALGELIEISSGKRPLKKSKEKTEEFYIPLIGASSVMGYVKEALYDEKILIIGRVGTHGVVQRYKKKCWPSDNTLVIKSNYYEYVYQLLKSIDYAQLNRGSTQPLITQTDIKNVKIMIPSKEVLKKYELIVGALLNKTDKLSEENVSLSTLRDTLLPKLMSGEIRVPETEEVVESCLQKSN